MFRLLLKINERWIKYLIICFVILFFSAMLFFYFKLQYQSVIGTEKDRINKVAHNIELYLNENLMALKLLAVNPDIQRSLDSSLASNQLSQVKQLLEFSSISLYDSSGNLTVGDTNQLFRSNVSDNTNALQLFNAEPVMFITNQLSNSQAVITLLVPVIDNAGSIEGMIAAELSLQKMDSLVMNQELLAGQYIFVFDKENQLVYHLGIDKAWQETALIKDWSQPTFFDDSNSVVLQKSLLDGGEKLYVSTSLNRISWQVVDAMPLGVLLGAILKKSLNDLFVWGLLLVCLAMLLAVLVQKCKLRQQKENANLKRLGLTSQLAAGIAHELRNPLTAIHGYIQFMIKKNQYPHQQELFTILLAETERMERLISEFLILSKPLKTPVYETVDVGQCVSNAVFLMKSQAINQNVFLEYIHPAISCYCYGNKEQLEQVWINLIRNALEAVDSAGRVQIAVRCTTTTNIVTVNDNGCGISEKSLAKLGDLFFTTKAGGTGLGLSICFSIIQQHGGKIEVKSDLNAGTVFIVYLPIKKQP